MKNIPALLISCMLFLSCTKPSGINPLHRTIITKVVIDGNSLAKGYLSTDGGYGTYLASLGYTVNNVSISGQSTLQMVNVCNDVDAVLGDSCVLIADEITNDLFFGASVDSAMDRIERYCAQRRAYFPGIKIIVTSPTPRNNHGTPSTFETSRQEVIARLHSATFYDELADVGSDSLLGAQGAHLNPVFYQGDMVHHTDSGYLRRGMIISQAIDNIKNR